MENLNINITDQRAFSTRALKLLILSDYENGFRCSERAREKLKNDRWGMGVLSTTIDNKEIVFVSIEEFKANNLQEITLINVSKYQPE